jgi:carbon-monoxide dehydrogenase large subunit
MNAPASTQQIGASAKRKEDYRFLTGAGPYPDDITQPNQTYAVFLRSPHAHAKIGSIDTKAAKASPGVVAIYTGADIPAAVLRSITGGSSS